MLFATPFITVYILILQGIIGAVLASFLACFAYRAVKGESVMKGRSHCDECGHVLGALDLIPIVSYISTGGKCRYCGKKISKTCLYGEIGLALLFIVSTLRFDLTWELLLVNAFICILYVVTLTDLYERIILDRCIITAIVIRIIYFFCTEGLNWKGLLWLIGNGLLIAGPILILTIIMELILKKDALGGGDIKLLFVMGLYLGWAKCLIMLFVACIAGIVAAAKSMKNEEDGKEASDDVTSFAIPFGPFLAAGAVFAMLVGDKIISLYLGLFF